MKQKEHGGDRSIGQVSLPDWDNITLENFPPIEEGGSIGGEFNSYAGYDLSREWGMWKKALQHRN